MYQTVAERWQAFREQMEQSGGLPKFVVREFEEFLKCGILEEGCLHLVCRSCGFSEVVAFSCKKRGFCPGCLGRRMADTAVHLEESVLPRVPVRHWVCSLPWGLRALVGYDRELCAKVGSAFVGELMRSLAKRAKRELGLSSVRDAHAGAVCAVQRTDGALRLNVHMHVLALDGVYVRDRGSGKLEFHPLDAPTRRGVEEVARRTADRVEKILRKACRSLDPEMQGDAAQPALELDEPGLASCYAAAAGGISVSGERAGLPALRLVSSSARAEPGSGAADGEPVAEVRGINVHAKQRVDGRDRKQLERLCRYVTRPPLSQERLERRPDGALELVLKHAWKDGTRAVVLDPDDLMVRLVAAVPPPYFHTLRYFGTLSSHSSLRKEVVPSTKPDPSSFAPPPAAGDQLELGLDRQKDDEPPRRKRWAWLLRHVFKADLDTCPRCSGADALGRSRQNARGCPRSARSARARPSPAAAPTCSAARAAHAAVHAVSRPSGSPAASLHALSRSKDRRSAVSLPPAAALPAPPQNCRRSSPTTWPADISQHHFDSSLFLGAPGAGAT